MSELGNKSNIKEIVEWILCILIAIILALLVRHFIFTPTVVRQTSMKTTMEPGDRLVLDRWSITTKKEIKIGDIITFEKPSNADNNKESYIKRVIGVAGDKILIEDGKVYRNGEELNETYLHGKETPRKGPFYDFTVPEGYVFAMGDNRSASSDCRAFGCIPVDKIESKVWIRFWPFDKFGKVLD